jgi:GNAT superfamily N-acetyltransferase
MKIVDFTTVHVEQAAHIALQNYEVERKFVSALPLIKETLDLTSFAENGLGVAAFDGDSLIGFLCTFPPFKNAFRSTDATGVFSPMGANGAIGNNRAEIYVRMYQAAGEKWVQAGAVSHAVCLYAHDKEVQEQFFRYGFGMRTADAIREMKEIEISPKEDYQYVELPLDEHLAIYPLYLQYYKYQCDSPYFLNRKPSTREEFDNSHKRNNTRLFVAKQEEKICAFLSILRKGETFIADETDCIHVGNAFCLPEHRGKGIYQNLLNTAIRSLQIDGYTRFGVDFETFNPAAWRFWRKYFDVYTHGVVRRIDEHILQK